MRGSWFFGALLFQWAANGKAVVVVRADDDSPTPDPDQIHIIKEVMRIVNFFGNATEALQCFHRIEDTDRRILHKTKRRCERCLKDDKCVFFALPDSMSEFNLGLDMCMPRIEPLPRGMLLLKVHEDQKSCTMKN